MAILNQTIAIPIWAAVVSIVAIVAIAVLLRGLETKRQLAAVIGIAALLAAVSGAIVSSDRAPLATAAPADRAIAKPDTVRRALDARPPELAMPAAAPAPHVPVTAAPPPTTAAYTAMMALAGSGLVLSSAVTSPLPSQARPAPAAVAGAPVTAERLPATAEPSSPLEASTARRTRGVVPPIASVLPNLEFPSSDSIPPVSIMNAEPPLPAADPAPSASSTAPKPSPRSQ